MAFAIQITLETAGDIEGLFKTRARHRHGGRTGPRAGAAEKQNGRLWVGTGGLERFGRVGDEIGIGLHRGIALPFDAMSSALKL